MKLICPKCGNNEFYALKETVAKTYLDIKYTKNKMTVINDTQEPFEVYEMLYLDCSKCDHRFIYDTYKIFNEGNIDLDIITMKQNGCRFE